jgi:hypothetical protein
MTSTRGNGKGSISRCKDGLYMTRYWIETSNSRFSSLTPTLCTLGEVFSGDQKRQSRRAPLPSRSSQVDIEMK